MTETWAGGRVVGFAWAATSSPRSPGSCLRPPPPGPPPTCPYLCLAPPLSCPGRVGRSGWFLIPATLHRGLPCEGPSAASDGRDWGWGGLQRNVFKGCRTPTLHFCPELSRRVGSVPLTARFAFSFVKKTSKSVCGWQTFWKSVRQKQGQQRPRRRESSVLPTEAAQLKPIFKAQDLEGGPGGNGNLGNRHLSSGEPLTMQRGPAPAAPSFPGSSRSGLGLGPPTSSPLTWSQSSGVPPSRGS